MALSDEFVLHLEDLFSIVPETVMRRMFGGIGIFRHGLMYALATSEGMVAFKVDDETVGDFEAAGAQEWVYSNRSGKPMRMGYWYVPESILEDRDDFRSWALAAFGAAKRADDKKPVSERKYSPVAL
jgi:DNA transformation protein and related proteins